MLTWLPFSADSAAMVCSAQKVKIAVESAKISASSHVTNSILKNAAKWLVYAHIYVENLVCISAILSYCSFVLLIQGMLHTNE